MWRFNCNRRRAFFIRHCVKSTAVYLCLYVSKKYIYVYMQYMYLSPPLFSAFDLGGACPCIMLHALSKSNVGLPFLASSEHSTDGGMGSMRRRFYADCLCHTKHAFFKPQSGWMGMQKLDRMMFSGFRGWCAWLVDVACGQELKLMVCTG